MPLKKLPTRRPSAFVISPGWAGGEVGNRSNKRTGIGGGGGCGACGGGERCIWLICVANWDWGCCSATAPPAGTTYNKHTQRSTCQRPPDAVADGRLRPRGVVTWRTERNARVVSDSGPFAPLRESTTSSEIPEVHNVLDCRQMRTEPRPRVTCTESLVKFGRVVFETRKRTDRQTNKETDRQATRNTL